MVTTSDVRIVPAAQTVRRAREEVPEALSCWGPCPATLASTTNHLLRALIDRDILNDPGGVAQLAERYVRNVNRDKTTTSNDSDPPSSEDHSD